MKKNALLILITWLLALRSLSALPQRVAAAWPPGVDREVAALMKAGAIPGIAVVLVDGNKKEIKYYGYADLEKKIPVTSATLFEIGSCSKAFTAVALAKIVKEGKINLDEAVSTYLPWLHFTFEGKPAVVTLRQLMHHTSGIPWHTISLIKPMQGKLALGQTIRALDGQELLAKPGTQYEYATINYDVLALVIQQVTGVPFEQYLQEQVITALQLTSTTVGQAKDASLKATGYKSSFFSPQPYNAPRFAGNNAAGYVISNATDMGRWLRFQMGQVPSELAPLAWSTHQRDETVPLHGMAAYAAGWQVLLDGTGSIYHDGYNPSFTAYVAFRPSSQKGVVVLANAASNYTAYLGERLLKLAAGDELKKENEYNPGDGGNEIFSFLSIIFGCFIGCSALYLVWLYKDLKRNNRQKALINGYAAWRVAYATLLLVPFGIIVYLLPQAVVKFSWDSIFVWTPFSLPWSLLMLGAAMLAGVVAYAVGLCFPHKNSFIGKLPLLLLLSIIAGFANMAVIILITSALDSKVELKYLVFFYATVASLYLLGRRYVQLGLIKFSNEFTLDLRKALTGRILSISYQQFEQIEKSRVYTSINDDVSTVGNSSNLIITVVTSSITSIGAFIYLTTISFWATFITLALLVTVALVYYLSSKSVSMYMEQARDIQNRFITLVGGMVEGFKELSLQPGKKLEYKTEMGEVADSYRAKLVVSSVRFLNVFLVGEVLMIAVLGIVAFGFPKLYTSIRTTEIRSFIVILLFLIGPVSTIMNSLPAALQVAVSWQRIKQFLLEAPEGLDAIESYAPKSQIQSIKAIGLYFQYKNNYEVFKVGPINFEAKCGEVIFIVGGNGSGKTTFAKLITGLYTADKGTVLIDEKVVSAARLGQYFSVVFSPAYLFEKLYNIDLTGREEEVQYYLRILELNEKVVVSNNRFSTLNLSGGQRKRLALLLCYLEDSPIYLFDEWAADQDPSYRRFFYRTLLPEMRKRNKIVIAITHDDHYFDIADRILRMDMGSLVAYIELNQV